MSASPLPILHLSFPPHDQPLTSHLPASLLATQPPTTVTTLPQLPALPSNSFSALFTTPPPLHLSPAAIAALSKEAGRLLVGGAVVLVGLSGVGLGVEVVDGVRDGLVLGGFTGVRQVVRDGLVVLEATKPAWSAGASAKLSFARKTPAPAPTTAPTWNLSGNSLAEDDLMVDEDDLLARETERVEAKPKVAADCGTGGPGAKRKACKNCTCGLAEELIVEERGAVAATTSASKSACGNCSLGDAFRCAGCPFLGQPAFANNKVGGAVKLAL